MKKIILVFPVLFLLAAGCNSQSMPAQNQNNTQSYNESTNMAELNTYTSAKFNFTLQYPKDWVVSDGAGTEQGITITNKTGTNNPMISLAYNNSLAETSMVALPGKRSTLKEAVQYQLSNITPITISGVQGYKGTFTNKTLNYTGIEIWLEYQGHIYTISYDKSLDTDKQINNIVSSLVFTK